ncbi:hypothetical protein B0H16DRAFT_1787972 [Mycena metata]|uniref:Uncharacterized protein n=1 Tax=Mycena metata TaxID=1033252 RepID=A0AAD7HMI5_9AGAR|nr:hypothetical protein B0H16DRAFT_1787972 [Mycena metata]
MYPSILFFYFGYEKAWAQARAQGFRPRTQGSGSGLENLKPEPAQAEPEPGHPGRAGPATSLSVWQLAFGGHLFSTVTESLGSPFTPDAGIQRRPMVISAFHSLMWGAGVRDFGDAFVGGGGGSAGSSHPGVTFVGINADYQHQHRLGRRYALLVRVYLYGGFCIRAGDSAMRRVWDWVACRVSFFLCSSIFLDSFFPWRLTLEVDGDGGNCGGAHPLSGVVAFAGAVPLWVHPLPISFFPFAPRSIRDRSVAFRAAPISARILAAPRFLTAGAVWALSFLSLPSSS